MKKIIFIIVVILLCGAIATMIIDDQTAQRQSREELEKAAQTTLSYYNRISEVSGRITELSEGVNYHGERPYIIRSFAVNTPLELQTAASLAEKYQFPLVITIDTNQPAEVLRPMLDMLGTVDCELVMTGSPVTEDSLALADAIRQEFPDKDSRCYLLRGADSSGKIVETMSERDYSAITLINGVTTGWLENGMDYMEYTYFEEDSELNSLERTVKADFALTNNSMLLLCYDMRTVTNGKMTIENLEKYFTTYVTEYFSGIIEAIEAIDSQKEGAAAIEAENAKLLAELQEELDALYEAMHALEPVD